jgi:hypothetical protein
MGMGLTFEWTVKLGDILTWAARSWWLRPSSTTEAAKKPVISMSLNALSKEFGEMKSEFKTFSETLQKIAVQETKIELLMKWYDELRHGDWLHPGAASRNVDGEYKRLDASHEAPRQTLPDPHHRRHLRPDRSR